MAGSRYLGRCGGGGVYRRRDYGAAGSLTAQHASISGHRSCAREPVLPRRLGLERRRAFHRHQRARAVQRRCQVAPRGVRVLVRLLGDHSKRVARRPPLRKPEVQRPCAARSASSSSLALTSRPAVVKVASFARPAIASSTTPSELPEAHGSALNQPQVADVEAQHGKPRVAERRHQQAREPRTTVRRRKRQKIDPAGGDVLVQPPVLALDEDVAALGRAVRAHDRRAEGPADSARCANDGYE